MERKSLKRNVFCPVSWIYYNNVEREKVSDLHVWQDVPMLWSVRQLAGLWPSQTCGQQKESIPALRSQFLLYKSLGKREGNLMRSPSCLKLIDLGKQDEPSRNCLLSVQKKAMLRKKKRKPDSQLSCFFL